MKPFYYIILVISVLALLYIGFMAVFYPNKVIAFILKVISSRVYFPKWHARLLQGWVKHKWFSVNLRIAGVGCLITAVIILLVFLLSEPKH